jgi:hypothetical protein
VSFLFALFGEGDGFGVFAEDLGVGVGNLCGEVEGDTAGGTVDGFEVLA